MAAHPQPMSRLQEPNRRSFLWSLACVGLSTLNPKCEGRTGPSYRFLTPECEVRMSVQFFANGSIDNFGFQNAATNPVFCLSAFGEKDRACLQRFVGSVAIAHYDFRSRIHSTAPLNLRERVLTIDHDRRIAPRPPFERVLAIQRQIVSDIQAFGYNPDDPQQAASSDELLPVWCLLRQDLYLNDQTTAFLIVHWKHTLNFISLVDVIPGDRTKLISDHR